MGSWSHRLNSDKRGRIAVVVTLALALTLFCSDFNNRLGLARPMRVCGGSFGRSCMKWRPTHSFSVPLCNKFRSGKDVMTAGAINAINSDGGNIKLMDIEELLLTTDPTVELQANTLYAMAQREALGLKSSVIDPWIQRTVLNATDLADVMAKILSAHLEQSAALFDLKAASDLIEQIFATSPAVRRGITADLTKVIEADPAVTSSILQPLLNYKGLHATSLARVSRALWLRGTPIDKQIALTLQSHGSMAYGIDIHPAANLGDGIFIDHATGLVIGETAVVGNNVMILHGVTLGATGKRVGGKRHPTIGNGVTLGALATILGDVTIGNGATVGAQAVVTKDVMIGETVVGINKVLDSSVKRQRLLNGESEDTWFYNI